MAIATYTRADIESAYQQGRQRKGNIFAIRHTFKGMASRKGI